MKGGDETGTGKVLTARAEHNEGRDGRKERNDNGPLM